jgi:uncharacterized membrane protein YhiD involved in acid resistance
MLSIVGAVVMLIVGASLARAFGIVGVASLVRYRTKIDDPKDAVVMLASLTVGLASGVELYGLALFSTLFILALLWVVESFEPEMVKTFDLKITGPDPASLRPQIEGVFKRFEISYELRSTGPKELQYEAKLPYSVRTDKVSNALLRLEENGELEVVWEEKKKK